MTNSLNILILDDESAIKENMNIFLEDEGFSVCAEENAENALELLKSGKKIDVGIIDLRLPGMRGDRFIEEARKICPHMKFVIHTGSLNFELSEKLIELGITDNDIFKKPIVDIDSLIKRLNEIAG